MKSKSILSLVIALAMLVGMAGFAGAQSSEKTIIKLATYGYDFDATISLENCLDDFRAKYPQYDVQQIVFSTENHLQKILSMAMVKSDEWDITWCGSDAGEYVAAGAFECLTPYLERSGLDLTDASKYMVNSGQAMSIVNGEYYSLPYQCDTRIAAYNMNVFKKLGLTEADIPKTMNELWTLIDLCKEKYPEMTPFGMVFADYLNMIYQMPIFLWGEGGNFIQWDEQKQGFNASLDNELGVHWVKTMRRLGKQAYGDAVTTMEIDAMYKAFAADNCLTMWTGPWVYARATELWGNEAEASFAKTKWATIPAGSKYSASSMGGQALGMNAHISDKQKEAAWALMEWIYSDAQLNAKLAASGLPIMVDAYKYPPFSENPDYAVYAEQLKTSQPVVDLRCNVSTGISRALFNPAQEIMLGTDGLSDEEAARWLNEVVQEALDSY